MRKFTAILLMALSFATPCFAESYKPELTRSFTLQAGYGEVAEIHIEPVTTQSQAYISGMPFNIEDDTVQYGATVNGREIAHWDVLSNTSFNMTVNGTKLLPMDENGSIRPDYEGLDYHLTFIYDLGYVDVNGNQASTSGSRRYYSGDASSGQFTGILPPVIGGYAGGIDGSIFFMFDEESSRRIEADNSGDLPAGEYAATVTVTLEAVQ